ncbi:MAG: D-alanyl-D-alanine carboxypeptidase [Clostridia bacterium]|nr:D-alanyl-D-alanine carboxypeptidase [Clostridia bacterium]
MNKVKKIALFLLCAVLLSSFAFAVSSPAKAVKEAPPIEKAQAAYVSCIETGEVLYLYNADSAIYTASSTKLMTAIVSIETLSDRLDEKITVTAKMLSEVSGNRLGLQEGEIVSIRDLIYILVTGGNNDAAYCLAYLSADSVEAFVDMMNDRAATLGAHNTFYTNPTGMHDELMKTTVSDTAKIAKHAWSLSLFVDASSSQKYVMEATNMSEFRNIYNRNCLISKYYNSEYFNGSCAGLNAGSTPQGGHCVITVAKNEDLSYLILVMGAESNEDTIYSYYNVQNLIDWAFSSFAMIDVLKEDRVICELPVSLSSAVDYVTVAPAKTISAFLPTDVDIEKEVEYSWTTKNETLEAPLKTGDPVGQISAVYKGSEDSEAKILGTCDLVATADVERSDFLYTLNRIEEFTKKPGFIAAIIFGVIASAIVILLNARMRKTRGPY